MSKRSGAALGARFAIVASRYNPRYVDTLVRVARAELVKGGAGMVKVVRVPGAFEIPAVASKLARNEMAQWSAILCIGVILRGETVHAEQVGNAVSLALVRLQVEHALPFIHGVYLFENEEQARIRCLESKHCRGIEVAHTALEMSRVMAALS